MFRRTAILGLSLALGAAAPLVLAVDAESQPAAAVAPPAAAASDASAPTTAPPAEGRKTAPKFVRTDCSGTRIRASAGKPCSPSSTLLRSWSQEDLQRTGQIQIGDALRLLDPIFR